mgnify:CR=1 FL=1
MDQHTMPPVELQNDRLRLTVDPDHGAGILALGAFVDDTWLSLMPDTRRADCDLACASFLMVPYSNRIENGTFTFAGRTYQLQNADSHAIHGDTRKRPWRVTEQSQHHLRCTFSSAEHQPVNWPWPFDAEASFELRHEELHLGLRLTNRGGAAMPAGFGWHPYFSRALRHEGEPVALQFTLDGAYPDAHGNRIPSGPLAPLSPQQDFSRERLLAPDNFLDTCCHGFTGGHISWPQSGVRLRFAAAANCQHLVLYNPEGKPYFAVEPVTNANNGVNLLAQGDPTCGTVPLEPGASLDSSCTMTVEPM